MCFHQFTVQTHSEGEIRIRLDQIFEDKNYAARRHVVLLLLLVGGVLPKCKFSKQKMSTQKA